MIADPMSGSGPHGETAEVVMRRAVVLTIDGVDPDAEVPVELSRRVLVDSPTAWAVLTGVTYAYDHSPLRPPPRIAEVCEQISGVVEALAVGRTGRASARTLHAIRHSACRGSSPCSNVVRPRGGDRQRILRA